MLDFSSNDTPALARSLLGTWLCRQMPDGSLFRARITETEAYHGTEDLACHASKGRTPRTEVMFGPPGHLYMYLCYGVHWMLNIVTGPVEFPAAILIRAVEGIRGPGRLSKALQLDRQQNRLPLEKASGLWLEEGNQPLRIEATPRIGIDTVPSPWHEMVWRFVAEGFS